MESGYAVASRLNSVNRMTKIAIPTDEHIPFQDDRARAVALKIVADYQPDIRIAGSDGVDFYMLSRFDKNPLRAAFGLQGEIDMWKASQREWRDAAPMPGRFSSSATTKTG